MAVAGIDFSTWQADVCIISEDDETAEWHVFPFGKQGDAFDRARRIRDCMPSRGWWIDQGVIAVGIEDPRGASRKVDAPIYRAQGAIVACLPSSLLVVPWKPQQWRSELGIAPHGKEAPRDFALGRWVNRPDEPSQDLCDAFGIGVATRQRIVVGDAA